MSDLPSQPAEHQTLLRQVAAQEIADACVVINYQDFSGTRCGALHTWLKICNIAIVRGLRAICLFVRLKVDTLLQKEGLGIHGLAPPLNMRSRTCLVGWLMPIGVQAGHKPRLHLRKPGSETDTAAGPRTYHATGAPR